MIRSGFKKSLTALPSLRNSGLEATAKSCFVSLPTISFDDLGCAHRYGALVDDHRPTSKRAPNLRGSRTDLGEVRAVFTAWSPDGDKHGGGTRDRIGGAGRKSSSAHAERCVPPAR